MTTLSSEQSSRRLDDSQRIDISKIARSDRAFIEGFISILKEEVDQLDKEIAKGQYFLDKGMSRTHPDRPYLAAHLKRKGRARAKLAIMIQISELED